MRMLQCPSHSHFHRSITFIRCCNVPSALIFISFYSVFSLPCLAFAVILLIFGMRDNVPRVSGQVNVNYPRCLYYFTLKYIYFTCHLSCWMLNNFQHYFVYVYSCISIMNKYNSTHYRSSPRCVRSRGISWNCLEPHAGRHTGTGLAGAALTLTPPGRPPPYMCWEL